MLGGSCRKAGWKVARSRMSIQQTRTCRRYRRESLRDAKFCAQCGADLTPFARREVIIALGLTSLVFILTPIYLVSSIDPVTVGLFFGLPYIAALLFITFLMAVYSGGAAIISAVIRRNNRSAARGSAARGVLVGVGVGLLFGVASCTASFAVYVWRAIHASLSLRGCLQSLGYVLDLVYEKEAIPQRLD